MATLANKIIFSSEDEAIRDIDTGADVNEFDEYGFRPLIEAIICKKTSVLLHLIKNGADIEQPDILGRTPLQWACDRSELEYCRILLENGANPNHYSLDGQPILVNPILREEYELVNLLIEHGAQTQFAQDFISAKLLGHRFELSGETDITTPTGTFIPLSFEGFYLEFTCDLIKRSVNNFINSMPGNKFKKIHAKLNKIINALKNAGQLMMYAKHKDKTPFEPVIDALLSNELLIIPVAHRGHAITFVKYGDIWAKCDRGVKNIVDTVIIYKIKNPYVLNKQFLKDLLYKHKPENYITEEIKHLLSLEYLQKLPTKSQIAGNCSWANVEASVVAGLFALCYHDAIETRTSTGILKRSIMSFYSSWVSWDKDSALEEAINDFDNASSERKISKAIILGSIFSQRCHHKKPNEVQRAKKIIAKLANPEFDFILKIIRNIHFKKRNTSIGKNIIKLFELCDFNIETLTLNHPIKKPSKIASNHQIKMTTALHVACLNGQIESVKYLLEKVKMDVNYLDRTGSTALMYASWKGYEDIVKYLVQKQNADVTLVNHKGGTAKRYAQYSGFNEIALFLEKEENKKK